MIRNVLMMATSGVVLFSKEFVHSVAKPRLVGSLLTAMLEFSLVTAGMPVSYIELSGLGVTIVGSEATKVFCALFQDREDGADFGKLLATEILNAFQDEYSSDLGKAGLNLKDFHGFHSKLADVIRRTAQPILNNLALVRGIQKVVLVTEGPSSQVFQTADIDQLGVLANLQALVGLSTDIMAHCGDSVRTVTIEGGPKGNSRIMMWRVERSTLVVAANKAISPSRYQRHVDEAVDLLHKLSRLTSNLHIVTR